VQGRPHRAARTRRAEASGAAKDGVADAAFKGYEYFYFPMEHNEFAPHGVIELTAIQIAGAAGLLIAAGIVAPGPLRRRDAIARNAQRAGILIAGVASMLLVAGTIPVGILGVLFIGLGIGRIFLLRRRSTD